MKTFSPQSIRLIAVDLDGTLLTRAKTVTERAQKAIAACRERGMLFAFATGRSYGHALPFIEQLRPDAAVLNYGAHIIIGGQTLFHRRMSPRVANQVRHAAAEARRIRFGLENDLHFDENPSSGDLPLNRNAPFDTRVEYLSAWDLPEEKARLIAKEYGCALTQIVGSRWCNFGPRGTGKGAGMKKVMRALNIERGQAIGFGDEDCDIEFFRACGTGVAMANGDEATKKAADFITKSNENDGVAAFLYDNILSGHR